MILKETSQFYQKDLMIMIFYYNDKIHKNLNIFNYKIRK